MRILKDAINLSYNEKIVLEYWIKHGEFNKDEIAKKLGKDLKNPGMSALYYKNRLKKYGVVRGEFPDIDINAIGYKYFTTIMIKLTNISDLDIFKDTMAVLPEVRECYIVKGTYDFILEIMTPTEKHHKEFINYIRNMGMIEKIMIFEKQECVFSKPYLPIFI